MAAGTDLRCGFLLQRLGENMKASLICRLRCFGRQGTYDYAAAKNANEYLRLAAKIPDSFYGMLARKALGMSNGLNMTIDL